MRLDPPAARRRTMSLTPIIDVVFLLLLFFMLASTFSRYARVDVTLGGRVAATPSPEAAAILLSVDARGFSVNGIGVPRGKIAQALTETAKNEKARILVRPSQDAVAENIVHAVEQAETSGLGTVALVR